jgi:hypothetical protein
VRRRLDAGLLFALDDSFKVSELELWLVVEALLKVVRILVRGEEAELGWEVDDQEEFGEFGKQEVEFDSKAELEMATPPHLRTSSLS